MIELDFDCNPYAEQVLAKVLIETEAGLVECTCEDVLQDFAVERVEEKGKFFGYGICQKINIQLIDLERELSVNAGDKVRVWYGTNGADGDFFTPYPPFYISEVNRDETTNTISVTAYDKLYKANTHTVAELELPTDGYSVTTVAEKVITVLKTTGLDILGLKADETCFNTFYEVGANFDGKENLRQVLNAIAEATQTIYYLSNNNHLVFKRMDITGEAVIILTQDEYYLLDSKTNRRLGAICHATELGDNVTASLEVSGTTQYVRNNPFWELREDVATLLDNALAAVGGMTINQFSMSWCGNFLLEIGDKIGLTAEDGSIVYSYLLNDVVRFAGYIDEETQWSFEENDSESASNPTTLGEVLNQTFARVDKANQEIELLASRTSENESSIANLNLSANKISASVSALEQSTNSTLENMGEELATISKKVETQITEESVAITVRNELNNGISAVKVSGKDYIFNEDGLHIEDINPDSNENIKTIISNKGMSVSVEGEEKLTANNEGVKAVDLHATTYLVIGTNSRFEDYGGNRTGCFWIGGKSV